MGRIAIACYRPKPGKQEALEALVRTHVPCLLAQGLTTDRAPILMQANDGTVVEVFEWKSEDAIERAHSDPAVLAIWNEYEALCDYVPIAQVPEAAGLFADFTPLD
jgi:quinol monooxygenase YgiN